MDIYVNTKKKVRFIDKCIVKIEDVADIEAENAIKKKIEKIPLLKKTEKLHQVIAFNDIVNAIIQEYPNKRIINTGENETLIEWSDRRKEGSFLTYIKIVAVCLILFVGASTAIMTFHTDSQLGTVLEKYTELFLGQDGNKLVIQVAYSIGLTLGIVVFFNHFGGRKLTDDPTPIQVEMALYENDVTDTVVSAINKDEEMNNKKDNKRSGK